MIGNKIRISYLGKLVLKGHKRNRARARAFVAKERKKERKNPSSSSSSMGKTLAATGRVLLSSLFLFAGLNKYHALVASSTLSDFHLLEHSLAPRFAETRAALSASLASMFPSRFSLDEQKIMEQLLLIDDASVAMFGTVVELLGAVLLMFNFTLGSKLLMLFIACVTPVMHPFWRREELSAAREIEAIMFWKNVAIFGALMMHVGMSKEEAKNKEKEE